MTEEETKLRNVVKGAVAIAKDACEKNNLGYFPQTKGDDRYGAIAKIASTLLKRAFVESEIYKILKEAGERVKKD